MSVWHDIYVYAAWYPAKQDHTEESMMNDNLQFLPPRDMLR
jgi:hypothetical protein